MQLRSLLAADFTAVHSAFLEAFSDYAVPLQLSTDQLGEMLRRRGYAPEASVGVFDGDQLVAFTLNGFGLWNGLPTGYDTGTGVVPSHRGRRLTQLMLDASVDILREHGAERYLLELLQSNQRALKIYRGAGFEITRELQCWRVEAEPHSGGAAVTQNQSIDWNRVSSFLDVSPSWQNSIDSIQRAGEPHSFYVETDGADLVGVAVVFTSGDLPLLAVERSVRRRGIGRKLLRKASTGRSLRVMNTDVSAPSLSIFLEACGAIRTVAQFEMLRML